MIRGAMDFGRGNGAARRSEQDVEDGGEGGFRGGLGSVVRWRSTVSNQRFRLEDYIPVQERINQFWIDHPEGHIVTMLMSDPSDFELCRYRAEIYRSAEDARPAAIGHAFERAGQGMANQTSHEENCETSAIGRALANLGYATSHKSRPSREEMAKVDAQGGDKKQPTNLIDQKGLSAVMTKAQQRQVRGEDVQAVASVMYGVSTVEEMTTDQGRRLYRWLNSAADEEIAEAVMSALEQAQGGDNA